MFFRSPEKRSDLPWTHVPEVSARQIKQLLEAEVAFVVYVYSPTCGACIARFKAFDDAVGSMPATVKNRFVRYNARPSYADSEEAYEKFKSTTGMSIQYYPSVFGFTSTAASSEYKGSYDREDLERFLRSLQNSKRTHTMN